MKRIALFFCFIFSFAAHANNIIVNGTRFIYPGNEKEITVPALFIQEMKKK